MPLTLSTLLPRLADVLERKLAQQAMAGDHPHRGAWINPNWDLPDPQANATGAIVTGCIVLLLAAERGQPLPAVDLDRLSDRAAAGIGYLCSAQNEHGRIDNASCNPDSDPDTAFVVQQLCPLLGMLRETPVRGGEAIIAGIERFVSRAAPGLREGGFHTPNHRWVIASALAWCERVLSDFDSGPALPRLLAETVDIDADGAYQERSVEGYDAVSGRSLLMIHELCGWPEAVEAVSRNLELDRYLLHADLTCEIGLSHRLYHDRPTIPLSLAHVALMLHRLAPDPRWPDLTAALFDAYLLQPVDQESLGGLIWLAWICLRDGAPVHGQPPVIPSRYTRCFPVNHLIRHRHDALSISLFGQKQQLARLLWRDLGLEALSIRQSMLGPAGDFIASQTILHDDHHASLISDGLHAPKRLAYWYPLGASVPVEQWEQAKARRDFRPVPPAAMQLNIEMLPDGAAFHLTSQGGYTDVPAQIALDFRLGGQWLTPEGICPTMPGQTFFHRTSIAAMRYGQTQFEITGGHYAHGMRLMRDALPAPNHVRILITLMTPLDHQFTLRATTARAL